MKRIILLLILVLANGLVSAQTKEELLAEKGIYTDSIKKLQKKADALQSQVDDLPGWRFKTFGTIGGSISGFNNWYSKETPNSSVGNFGFNINSTADLIQDKFFWKNATNINISWVKFDDKDDTTDSEKYEVATDIFTLSSLYGHKLSKKFAISALGEYRSTLVQNFNNPGFLDLGIGATWTPIKDLIIVIHPLDYNFVFSRGDNVYESSFGAKIVADYSRKFGNFNIKSNLSMFQSYKSSNYSNYTWTNSLAYTIWKGIGLGFDFGLRKNKQEALNYNLETDPDVTFDNIDNKLQSYWLFGLNFKF
ncbi:MAG: DUF3078 domain-containing protein [Flavobacteriaceae bacterium]|nr:DUF3078 domain-containing protein [Flavobacteriaceae bacterium]